MTEDALARLEEEATLRALHRLLLGREPEAGEIESIPDRSLGGLITTFTGRPEYWRRFGGHIGHEFYFNDWPMAVEAVVSPEIFRRILAHLSHSWTELGRHVPHWSVLTNPKYLPESLDPAAEAEFYASGGAEIEAVLRRLGRLGLAPPRSARVLDFGCGLGRLGEHLSARFDHYRGVDVSEPHRRIAARRLTRPGVEITGIDDFLPGAPPSEGFDLVVSLLTLQHNPPPLMLHFFRGLVAAIAPGGVAYLQIPTWLRDYRFEAAAYLRGIRPEGGMEMHAVPQELLFTAIRDAGCQVAEVVPDGRVGAAGLSLGFVITRPA